MLNTLHTRTVEVSVSPLWTASPKTGGGTQINNHLRRQIACREHYQREYSVHSSTSLSACFYRVLLLATRFRTRFWEAPVSASANIVATNGQGGMADGIFETGINTVTAKLYSRGVKTAPLLAAQDIGV